MTVTTTDIFYNEASHIKHLTYNTNGQQWTDFYQRTLPFLLSILFCFVFQLKLVHFSLMMK